MFGLALLEKDITKCAKITTVSSVMIFCDMAQNYDLLFISLQYILPKLLKTGSTTLQHIVSKLSTGSLDKGSDPSLRGQQLGAMIICLRRARALGQLQGLSNRAEKRRDKERKSKPCKNCTENFGEESETEKIQFKKAKTNETDQSNPRSSVSQSDESQDDQSNFDAENTNHSDLWYGVVEVDVLRQALSSRDDQVCFSSRQVSFQKITIYWYAVNIQFLVVH